MSRYNKFGFYRGKFDVSQLSDYLNVYPKYPDLPDAETFYRFIKLGFIQTQQPVANVNLTLGAPLNGYNNTGKNYFQFTMPDGNVALVTHKNTGVPSYIDTLELFKYDADAGNISRLTPTKTGDFPVDDYVEYSASGCLCYDGNVRIYQNLSSNQNVYYTSISTDYNTVKGVSTHSNAPGPILLEDCYPQNRKALALENNKVVLFSAQRNAFNAPEEARCVIHDIATDKFSNTTFQYDGVDGTVIPFGDLDINAVMVPGSGSVGSDTGNVYVIPGKGFLLNGEPGSGTVPSVTGPRCVVEFDTGANVVTRFTPSGADLTTGGSTNADTLYQGACCGVDGNVYSFPGQIKKDIMVLDPSNRSATQSTFGIFNTTGGNTIQCYGEAITAPDGYAYIRARGVQSGYFSGTQDFWLSIDTNPTSATYQQGNCIPIDPNGVYTNETERPGQAVAKDGLIISNPTTNERMATLKTYGNGGYWINIHPALLTNFNQP